ncbi:delta 1-pyrroline-5-carboxylate reductase [Friedmanniomyces endolithicus]|uniref:Pyrroline-5-carboxylate reductase n=1 Tax=Friedmanniomyces endolithicus TaxID=329885 RepID=A0AAN6JZW0_9PEZI|nr:delta 1-pyrroline-5-carboxylate reductase [Friedmanniomyces endolithicus]KAK0780463.1 delta 1-pyrroline-5-carboxylate reductase [Friedmanniomyces endolithicus]KAK0854423.1 delta 1-pyrroline-5-carboxylate reductase [Friedmanniomyces endolithicus]KAK0872558.1 delta 1-pyrroline-5-carboxylate reductase [Friedmanniomyces endolithicus]KAK0893896.1 delta 1-pyrroline-5-carboxylate reductase [Friedmanniomyces endolithicus]
MERDLTPDWILKQTLNLQQTALMSFLKEKENAMGGKEESSEGLTLTVLGCGTMGIAILGGILDSLSSSRSQQPDTAVQDEPRRLPSRFNACVRSLKSAERIKRELGQYEAFKHLTIHQNSNVKPTQEADIIILGCKPHMVRGVLRADGMQKAVKGKLVISICAGLTEEQIVEFLPSATHCTVVRALPNTAAAVRESMTVIATSPTAPLDPDTDALMTWIFTRIGRVARMPSANMDACTALCGSGPAFIALIVESMAAGAIAMGIPRDDAYLMAAQTARGMTQLILTGGEGGKAEHPAILRDKVSTPGGCTIGGLLVLEEAGVRGTLAKAVREATVVAGLLGEGKGGVNGTRSDGVGAWE